MKIAIMSDSHDNLKGLKWAFEIINELGIENVIHLGDVISPFVPLRIGEMYKGNLWVVFGNNDGDYLKLAQNFRKFGWFISSESPTFLEIEGKDFVLMHEPVFVDKLAETGDFNFILYGHLHKIDIRRVRNTLIINPGEIYGYISGKCSFVVLDTESLDVKVYEKEVGEVERIGL
ncbi:MAG: metallophosphoesterase [candidate division WOR-3 bacterium]